MALPTHTPGVRGVALVQGYSDSEESEGSGRGEGDRQGEGDSGESDDEPPVASQPIPIPGTSIVLETEEDIARWIEERKKNWPSRKRMAEKAQAEEARTEPAASPLPKKKAPAPCLHFLRTGKCRYGTKCTRSHDSLGNSLPARYGLKRQRLFQLLVHRDNHHANAQALALIKLLGDAGFFQTPHA